MSRAHSILEEIEQETGKTFDSNFEQAVLCDGDDCRHSECDCWDAFEKAARQEITKPTAAELSAASLDECFAGWRASWAGAKRSEEETSTDETEITDADLVFAPERRKK